MPGSHRSPPMKQYWYRYAEMRANAGVHADAVCNSSSYHQLNMAMRRWAHVNGQSEWQADMLTSSLYVHAIDYWGDFEDMFPHHFHYANVPEEKKKMAYDIVTALNKVKGAWAYALCLKDMPDYEAHPLRQKILDTVGLTPQEYDETVGLMREIVQSEGGVPSIQMKKRGSM